LKILQLHVDFVEYRPIKKEIQAAEEAEKAAVRKEELVVLFTAVETDDSAETAEKAVEEARSFLKQLGVGRLMIYPFAHLSQDLARPSDALPVLKAMEAAAKQAGLEVYRAPFGWNKELQVKVKGHPLAEMSRSYGGAAGKPHPVPKPKRELSEAEAIARVKKSDFGQLPETDHRAIGEKLDLFSFQEVSPGMVYWHPKGLVLRDSIMAFLRAELKERGYVEISTPALANTALWRVSGHTEHYRDNMFLTSLGNEELGMKPMNCPSTFLIYKSRKWSYRDLPVRYAIFDPLFRNELSGVASGLFRVKALAQDDAHIIATEGQAAGELQGMLDLMKRVYGVFGLEYQAKVSTMPDDHMGSDGEWKRATDALIEAVKGAGMDYEIKDKEGNFYAPKIDVDIKDSLGREWQCGTFQLDLQMPKRFNLAYTGADGKEHTPVVLHRTILGSLERFVGILIEHYQGRFPLWLCPVQAVVMPVSDEHRGYAEATLRKLKESGLRVEGDLESGTLNAKIRNAQLRKVPYMAIVGGKEESSGTVAVRDREGKTEYGTQIDAFVKDLRERAARYL
jgi:threonyl-tRNA synthetase